MEQFIERTFNFKYNPLHVVPLVHLNSDTKQYFMYRPFESGFLEQMFCFDMKLNRFMRRDDYRPDWDPATNDTFS